MALRGLIYLAAAMTVAVLVGLIGYILVKGVPHITWSFLSTSYSAQDGGPKGILPMIINTVYIVVITLLIVTPIGLSAAIYLTQYARQGGWCAPFGLPPKCFRGCPPSSSACSASPFSASCCGWAPPSWRAASP